MQWQQRLHTFDLIVAGSQYQRSVALLQTNITEITPTTQLQKHKLNLIIIRDEQPMHFQLKEPCWLYLAWLHGKPAVELHRRGLYRLPYALPIDRTCKQNCVKSAINMKHAICISSLIASNIYIARYIIEPVIAHTVLHYRDFSNWR